MRFRIIYQYPLRMNQRTTDKEKEQKKTYTLFHNAYTLFHNDCALLWRCLCCYKIWNSFVFSHQNAPYFFFHEAQSPAVIWQNLFCAYFSQGLIPNVHTPSQLFLQGFDEAIGRKSDDIHIKFAFLDHKFRL